MRKSRLAATATLIASSCCAMARPCLIGRMHTTMTRSTATQRGTLHTLQSVTKTVASVVFGVAITRGDLKSIDVPVLSFFDTTKVANIDGRKRRMTVRHLLTMTGGIDWNGSLPNADPQNTEIGLERSADWISYTINRPMMREPGTKFNYNSGEAALLAHVFREATGTDLEEYAAKYLFAPLGISHWFWKRSSSGSLDTEGGLYLEASDLARIWHLALSRGAWNGVQVVSREWMELSVTPAIATNTQPNSTMYGLYWWLYRDPLDPSKFVWGGSGFGGQHSIAFPRLDMITIVNSWSIGGGPGMPVRVLIERLSKAVQAP